MIEQYIQPLLNYLHEHPHIGLVFTFFVAFLESLPIIGTIFPGSITMTLIGLLVGSGALPAFLTIAISSVAAFAGDLIGYMAGYHYNDRIRTIWPFRKYPKLLASGEIFFKKHGGKSIVIGRFFGPVRSTVPLIAGLMKLSWMRFCLAAIPSAVLWALVYLSPGIILGAIALEIPHAKMGEFIIVGLLSFGLAFFAYWLVQHFFLQLARAINAATDSLWSYLSRTRSCRPFIRFITNHQNPEDHHQLTLFITALICGVLFLILLADVKMQGMFTALNQPIFHLFQSIRGPIIDKIFVMITIMGAPTAMTFSALLAAITLTLFKQIRAAAHIILALVLATGSIEFFKHISHSFRPQGFHFVAATSSFPSGHTTMSFIITSVCAFLIAQVVSRNAKWVSFTVSGIFILFIGISRLYLGAHWLTDIIGSILLGFCVLLICIISYRRMPRARGALKLSSHLIGFIFSISFLFPWIILVPKQFSTQLFNTSPLWPAQIIREATWWNSPFSYTPVYRNNRLGTPFQPFNVQWAGNIEKIEVSLEKQGWKVIPPKTQLKKELLKNTLLRFAHFNAEYHIPILPWLYQNKSPVLFMIKSVPNQKSIIELRLWRSSISFNNNSVPLYLGATDFRNPPEKLLSIKGSTKISLDNGAGLNQLFNDATDFQRKIIQTTPINFTLDKTNTLDWDGKVLLLRGAE